MSKHENPLFTEEVSSTALVQNLVVSRNYLPTDVFHKVHGIEPILLADTLATLKARHRRSRIVPLRLFSFVSSKTTNIHIVSHRIVI